MQMNNLFNLSVGTAICLLALCTTLEAFPYAHMCSDCLPNDEECILKCSIQEQETNSLNSMLQAATTQKRYQHQLRFGKRDSYGITGQKDILEESFRPQLRFGKRSYLQSKRRFMSHIRFGKRDQFDFRSRHPHGRFERDPEEQLASLNTPRTDSGVLELPAVFCGRRQEKRFRPQGRFGKRFDLRRETLNEDTDLPLYTGNLQSTSKVGIPRAFDDTNDLRIQLHDK
ncbi:uncharacterized protein LOC117321869 [Pecten maximus]|uniref:uncharacterized protein LOC117321869 n=1 Tax=Pecten maximus TaxID=6579 RepID=UPI001457FCFB|nr:uncharacterized protein LOC117321869 [Pecten maximus]